MFREGEFSIGYHRCDNDWGSADVSTYLRTDLSNAIMSRSNEQALALLRKIGYIGCLDGFGDANICFSECAAFYGVTEPYLRGAINRGQLRKIYPKDFYDVTISSEAQVEYLSCRGEMVKVAGRRVLLSPRFVLMVSMYISPVQSGQVVNQISGVIKALKRSTYRFPLVSDQATAVVKEEPVAQPSPVSAVVHEQAEQIEKPVVTDTVMISPEFFGKMVMSAAMELVKSRERA